MHAGVEQVDGVGVTVGIGVGVAVWVDDVGVGVGVLAGSQLAWTGSDGTRRSYTSSPRGADWVAQLRPAVTRQRTTELAERQRDGCIAAIGWVDVRPSD